MVFFQHGLIEYLDQMAIVVGAATPVEWLGLPIRSAVRGQSEPGDSNHLQLAVAQLADSLTSYVVEGYPRAQRRMVRNRALFTCVGIGAAMRKFLLCHEVAHLLFGHLQVPSSSLPQDAAWQRELDADLAGASLVAGGSGDAAVFNMWACDIALWCFQMLERGLAYLNTGMRTELPPTHSHPTPHWRRRSYLEEKTRELWELEMKDASTQLGGLIVSTAELGEQLWEATVPSWDALRRQGVRPAPVWRPRLAGANTEGGYG